jgi:hypothetical protein
MSAPSAPRSVSIEHAIAFALLTAIGLAALVVALGYGLFNEGARVGPGLVPAVVGAGIALIAGWEFVSTLRGRRASHSHGIAEVAASVAADLPASPASPASPAGEAGSAGPLDEATAGGGTATPGAGAADDTDIFGRSAKTRSRQLTVVFVALVVAVLLVPVLGFLVSFFVLSVFISTAVERRPWMPSLVISLIAALVVYAVFVLFLSVPLPTGLTGIGG